MLRYPPHRTLLILTVSLLLASCSSDLQGPSSSPELAGDVAGLARTTVPVDLVAEPQAGLCGDPDPSNVVLSNAFIYDIDGGDMITVIDNPFEDDSLIGYWLAVRFPDWSPIEYFRIIGNEHFDQWNISVFTVAEDLVAAGGGDLWWYYDGSETFGIVAPIADGPSIEDPTYAGIIKAIKANKLKSISSTVSFPNGSQVGQWLGVTPSAGGPDVYFEITRNTARLKPNGKWLNVFIVDGDLQGAGDGIWWKEAGQDMFVIYEPCN